MTQPKKKAAGRKAGIKPKPRADGCPLGVDALQAVELSHDLARALRRLRRDLTRCQGCSRAPGGTVLAGCRLQADYNSLVSQAVEEVWEEWSNHGGD